MEEQPHTPEEPTNIEVINHNIENVLLYAATAGNVACAGLCMAVAAREVVAPPDRDRSLSSAVAIAGFGIAAAITGRYAEKLKLSVDRYEDRYGQIV